MRLEGSLPVRPGSERPDKTTSGLSLRPRSLDHKLAGLLLVTWGGTDGAGVNVIAFCARQSGQRAGQGKAGVALSAYRAAGRRWCGNSCLPPPPPSTSRFRGIILSTRPRYSMAGSCSERQRHRPRWPRHSGHAAQTAQIATVHIIITATARVRRYRTSESISLRLSDSACRFGWPDCDGMSLDVASHG